MAYFPLFLASAESKPSTARGSCRFLLASNDGGTAWLYDRGRTRSLVMDDLTREFLLESYENLDRLDQEFVKLETEPENLELLKSIFRTIHTIKGTCGFLGFTQLEKLAHAGENLLSLLPTGI